MNTNIGFNIQRVAEENFELNNKCKKLKMSLKVDIFGEERYETHVLLREGALQLQLHPSSCICVTVIIQPNRYYSALL